MKAILTTYKNNKVESQEVCSSKKEAAKKGKAFLQCHISIRVSENRQFVIS